MHAPVRADTITAARRTLSVSMKNNYGGTMPAFRTITKVVMSAVVVLPVALVGATAATASATTTEKPITIAYITDVTGEGASENGDSPAGFEARIDLQNAEGGVNGHKLVPLVIDDQTSPTGDRHRRAERRLEGAFGIVSQSPLFFLAAKYPQQAGVPVTGAYDDGPEWGEQPYTNMFASDNGSVNPKYPVNTLLGSLLKAHGGTVLGSYGYSISPSSARAALSAADSFKAAGGKVGVLDTTVPFGSVEFTNAALVAKQNGVNAMVTGPRQQLQLRAGHRPEAGRGEAQGRRLRHRLRARRRHLAGLAGPPGRHVPVAVPPLGPSQRRHQEDAGGHGEVRALHHEPVPGLQPVRGVGRCRPDDQGPGDGRGRTRPGPRSSRTCAA